MPPCACTDAPGAGHLDEMRMIRPLLLTCLLLASCAEPIDEITIVAPGAARVLIQEDGGYWVELAPSDEIRVAIDRPFTLVGVCARERDGWTQVRVVRASLADGTRWWLGTCDDSSGTVEITIEGVENPTEVVVGGRPPEFIANRGTVWAPRGTQDVILDHAFGTSIVRDVDLTPGAQVTGGVTFARSPFPPELNSSTSGRLSRGLLLTRHGTYWDYLGIVPVDRLEPGDRQWITTKTTDNGFPAERGAFTRFTMGVDLPSWQPQQVDTSMGDAIGAVDARVTAGRLEVEWLPANSWDDQVITFEQGWGAATRWIIESHAGWIDAQPGRDRAMSFDYSAIPLWLESRNVDPAFAYEVTTQLGRVQAAGHVVGAHSRDTFSP